ncbi:MULTISPECIES: GHKL domain-containing protein [Lysinibacillus]|uniref:GHKL domain-containing protein n=1 Tax=Lysinibacillus TaxID=400634 RepID=UPI001CC0C57B|nr:GHKL domain-containing protein [Lysinibacillus sphaericus]
MEFFTLIIEFVLIFWAVTCVIQGKISIKSTLTYIVLIIFPTTLIYESIGQWQGIIYLIISSFIYFFWLSKDFLIFIHICFVLIIGILTDNLTQYIAVAIHFKFIPDILLHYCIFFVLFIISIQMYRILTRKIYILIGKLKTAYILILFILLVTMSTFYINIYLTEYFSKDSLLKFNIITQTIYFTIMIFVLYITIINIRRETHFRKIEVENAQFTNYMYSLELINNDMQKFQHDYTNILVTMQGYIEINDFEGLKKYFKKHIFSAEEETLKRNKRLANLSRLQITGIKGLIITKSLQAEKEGISVQVEISDEIDEISMNVIDLSRILGIFLDNAIEANNQNNIQEEKEINIAFFNSISDSTIIIIENTFNNDSLMIDQIFTNGFSEKGKNRGRGLNNVTNIIKNYPNVTLNTNINKRLFTQIIEITKNEGFNESCNL